MNKHKLIFCIFCVGFVFNMNTVLAQNIKSEPLKIALSRSMYEFEPLENWQRVIFEEEVLTQYEHFIRDYRPTASGYKIDVDKKLVKKTLSFYAPSSLQTQSPQILILLEPNTGCTSCMSEELKVKEQVDKQLKHRGFIPWWIQDTEALKKSMTKENDSILKVLYSSARQRGVSAALLLSWDQGTSSRAGSEYVNKVKTNIFVRNEAVKLIGREIKHEDYFEVSRSETYAHAVELALTKVFQDIGEKCNKLKEDSGHIRNEVWISVKGVKTYSDFNTLKGHIESVLGNEKNEVEQKLITRGSAVFLVRTILDPRVLQLKLAGLKIEENRKLRLIQTSGQTIELEIH